MLTKILILNVIARDIVHWWKPLCFWGMSDWTRKSWSLKAQFWWKPSIFLQILDCITKFNWCTVFSYKNISCYESVLVASKKHEILAIFDHLIQHIQWDLSDCIIKFFQYLLSPLGNTKWTPESIARTWDTRACQTFLAALY